MSHLPDVSCVIKVIDNASGTVLSEGGAAFGSTQQAIIRYVLVNDSNRTVGPFTAAGSLFRNNVRIQPDVIPDQTITLAPKTIWKKEFPISEDTFSAKYHAQLTASGSAAEESKKNNFASTNFDVVPPVR